MKKLPPYRTWAEIDLSALRYNLKQLRSLNPHAEVIGVIKADAYGHGMYEVARELARNEVITFAVANVAEAGIVVAAAPRSSVLILGPVLEEEIPSVIKDQRFIPTISSLDEVVQFDRACHQLKVCRSVHVKIDTGLGRIGCHPDEALAICEKIFHSKHLFLSGIFSHLSSADINRRETLRQYGKLEKVCETLIEHGYALPEIHIQNSSGCLVSPGSWTSYTRPGISLYGVGAPASDWKRRLGKVPLKPVMHWKTRVVLIRDLPKGSTVSYAMTYRAKRKTKTAVLSVGYADGVFRKLSNRGEVLIQGKRCKILGRVTMDLTMVDITSLKNVRVGDEAVIIGKGGKDQITAEEFSNWAETNPYEVFCHVGRRVVRIPVNESK